MLKKREDIVGAILLSFMIAVVFSWLPWLFYIVVSSVMLFLPDITWPQVTFFTWVGISAFFIIDP